MDVWQPRIVGASGRAWVVDQPQGGNDIMSRGRGRFFYGWPEDDPASIVWVQRVMGGDIAQDDRDHLRAAHRCSELDGIRDSPYVLHVLDIAEQFDMYLFQELASRTLKQAIEIGGLTSAELSLAISNAAAALDAIHAVGYVHCDVREDNIFDVGGVWKLGDLGASTPADEPMRWGHRDRSYLPAHVLRGGLANPQNDRFALEHIATTARPTMTRLRDEYRA